MPHGSGSVRSATASSTAHRCATIRSSVGSVVARVLVAAGAADHDLVLLDRDLDRPVAGPVLGVDGVVLRRPGRATGRSPPRRGRTFPRAARARACASASAAARACASASPASASSAASASAALRAASSAAFASSSARRTSSASSSAAIASSSDARRSTSSAAAGVGGAVAVGLQPVLALERLDLLHGHLELVRDPRVGTTLSHPPTDLVKLRTQRPAAHEQAGRLAKASSGAGPMAPTTPGRVLSAATQFGATSLGYPGTEMAYRLGREAQCSY